MALAVSHVLGLGGRIFEKGWLDATWCLCYVVTVHLLMWISSNEI
jgi:hypothetical protein